MNTRIKDYVQLILLSVLLFGISFWCWFKPATDFSTTERRELKQFPELSVKTLVSGKFMQTFEDYTLDQFPARDSFRTIKALTAKYVFGHLDNNDIFVTSDGMIGKHEYPLKQDQVVHAANKFKYVYNTYLKDNGGKVYLSVIPDKNAFIAEESGHLAMDYDLFFKLMQENTKDFATYIDISDLLSKDDYYLTDTHWKQECITDVADRLAEAMGTTLDKNYKLNTLEKTFAGVYYGQSALPVEKDTLNYLTSDIIDSCIIKNYETGKEMSMYDMEKANGYDLYETFLSGSVSFIVIENPQATTDKELVVFRDSFGSSLVPLLASGYKSITVIDIRYISSLKTEMPNSLQNLVDFKNKDVLFIYSTLVLNNSNTLK
ncbi:MAG: hypothetical protein IJN17_08045 [Clostridia bacterium]|nr:hypothetical protein [Clostridia bacterium]